MTATNVGEKEIIARFWSKVDKSNECWEWSAGKSAAGYGEFHFKLPEKERRQVYAHRFSYEITKGTIPAGLLIRHRCDNPKCVNPDHLLTGTKKDNSQDMASRGRSNMQKRTHCPRGHEFTPENTGYDKHKNCRICNTCANAQRVRSYTNANKKRSEALRLSKPIQIPLPPNSCVCMDCGILAPTTTHRKYRCKPCQNAVERQNRANNIERCLANSRKYKARIRAEKKAAKLALSL